jgi:uncharacterized protein (DUF433 family)
MHSASGRFDSAHLTKELEKVMIFARITVNPNQMGGVPCIRGLRIPVATVVDMVADRMTEIVFESDVSERYTDFKFIQRGGDSIQNIVVFVCLTSLAHNPLDQLEVTPCVS